MTSNAQPMIFSVISPNCKSDRRSSCKYMFVFSVVSIGDCYASLLMYRCLYRNSQVDRRIWDFTVIVGLLFAWPKSIVVSSILNSLSIVSLANLHTTDFRFDVLVRKPVATQDCSSEKRLELNTRLGNGGFRYHTMNLGCFAF